MTESSSDKPRKRRGCGCGSIAAVFGLLLLIHVGAIALNARWNKPPAGVRTLAEFFLEMRSPLRIDRVDIEGETHVVVFGKVGIVLNLLALPSGPPAYVFDSSGALVDWVGDSGDASAFAERWQLWSPNSRTITQAQALALIGSTSQPSTTHPTTAATAPQH